MSISYVTVCTCPKPMLYTAFRTISINFVFTLHNVNILHLKEQRWFLLVSKRKMNVQVSERIYWRSLSIVYNVYSNWNKWSIQNWMCVAIR